MTAVQAVIQADPYPWPWDGSLCLDRMAVVVAGAQSYWVARTVGAAAVLHGIASLADRMRDRYVPIVWIRHGRMATSRALVPPRESAEWQLVVAPRADIVVDAAGHDGCYGSQLDATLRSLGRDHLLMVGLGLEGPLHSTLRSLNDRGYECLTLADLCAPHELVTQRGALSTITLSFGIFGAVAAAADVYRAMEVAAQ